MGGNEDGGTEDVPTWEAKKEKEKRNDKINPSGEIMWACVFPASPENFYVN